MFSHSWTGECIWRKLTGLLLRGTNSFFKLLYMLLFIRKLRFQSVKANWGGTESTMLEVCCEASTISDDFERHVNCWSWSNVRYQFYSTPCLPLLTGFKEMLISVPNKVHTAQNQCLISWSWCHWTSQPEHWREINQRENLQRAEGERH